MSRPTAAGTTAGSAAPETVVNATLLRQAMTSVVDAGIFNQLKLHGNTKWQPISLVVLAVLWVWADSDTLTGAFACASRWAMDLFGCVAVTTYQGLTSALVTWSAQLVPLLQQRLQQHMQECGKENWRIGRWLPLAVDGSRVSTPRSIANEKAFCAPNYGKGKTAKYRKKKNKKKRRASEPVKPQVWLTLMWHMGLRLPWCWQTGPSHASERDHFRDLLLQRKFPENTLFCADAGFTGYDLWKAILDAGHSFLIRVGANVTLLRRLGYVREKAGTVYFWPDKAAKKHQRPLVLRLWRCRVGRCTMSLLTNVLDEQALSLAEIRDLYRRRWGVELQFRTLKQTFGRRKLRSKTPENALVELDWSLLGLWIVQLFAVKECVKMGEPPSRSSAALAIRIIRELLDRRHEASPEHQDLESRFQEATQDTYERKRPKQGRYRPKYKDKPAAGHPKVINAGRQHKDQLRELLAQAA